MSFVVQGLIRSTSRLASSKATGCRRQAQNFEGTGAPLVASASKIARGATSVGLAVDRYLGSALAHNASMRLNQSVRLFCLAILALNCGGVSLSVDAPTDVGGAGSGGSTGGGHAGAGGSAGQAGMGGQRLGRDRRQRNGR